MSTYRVQYGDSPARIARRFGVSMRALVAANPQKPTTVVAGQTTWSKIHRGEPINVPASGRVGDAASDAVAAMMAAGGPCVAANVPLVCAAQIALGVTADGKWGSGSSGAAAARGISAPPGCSPTPSFWGVKGSNLCTGASGGGGGGGIVPPSASVTVTAMAAAAALAADPSYCSSVGRTGTSVNAAVHAFKTAWNSANPSNPVPINTGNYEPSVAAALSSALGGAQVAPGCGGGGSPSPAPVAPSVAPSVTPVNVPAAVQAIVSTNPCAQSSATLVCAVQAALGLTQDGKYGNDTSAAVRRYVPNAPAACPTQPWWGAKGSSQCGGAAPSIPSIPSIPSAPAVPAAPTVIPGAPLQPILVPPSSTTTTTTTTAPAGVSKGAIVAGALGVAALLGVAAIAASGRKGARGSRGTQGRRGAQRKPAHKKAKPRKKHR